MSWQSRDLKRYINALAAKTPSPGGGSAVALVFCLGVSLMVKAMRYSLSKDKRLKSYIDRLVSLTAKIYPCIVLDAQIFTKIMKVKGKERTQHLKESERLIINLGRASSGVFSLAKQAESGIKKSIISDFYIGFDCMRLVLKGCVFNLEANQRIFGTKSKYIAIFKKDLKRWAKF